MATIARFPASSRLWYSSDDALVELIRQAGLSLEFAVTGSHGELDPPNAASERRILVVRRVPVVTKAAIGLGAAAGRRVEGRLGSRNRSAPGDRGCPAGGGARAPAAAGSVPDQDARRGDRRRSRVAAVDEYKPDVARRPCWGLQQRRGVWRPPVGAWLRGDLCSPCRRTPVSKSAERGSRRRPPGKAILTTIVRKYELRSARRLAKAACIISLSRSVGRTTIAYSWWSRWRGSPRLLVDGSLQFSDLRHLWCRRPRHQIVNLPNRSHSRGGRCRCEGPVRVDILLARPRVEMAEMVQEEVAQHPAAAVPVRRHRHARWTRRSTLFLTRRPAGAHLHSMAIRNLAMAGEAFDAIGYPATKLATVLEPILDRRHHQGQCGLG